METYQNVNGNSGIAGYEIGDTLYPGGICRYRKGILLFLRKCRTGECGGNEASGGAGVWTQFVY